MRDFEQNNFNEAETLTENTETIGNEPTETEISETANEPKEAETPETGTESTEESNIETANEPKEDAIFQSEIVPTEDEVSEETAEDNAKSDEIPETLGVEENGETVEIPETLGGEENGETVESAENAEKDGNAENGEETESFSGAAKVDASPERSVEQPFGAADFNSAEYREYLAKRKYNRKPLILALLGLTFTPFYGSGIIFGILALVLGASRYRVHKSEPLKWAIALSIVCIALSLAFILALSGSALIAYIKEIEQKQQETESVLNTIFSLF